MKCAIFRYKLSELPDVCALIDVCAAGVSAENTTLVSSVVELISTFQKVLSPCACAFGDALSKIAAMPLCCLLSQPLQVEKANQELRARDQVCAMFQLMARMLTVPSPLVQLAAVESLLFLASVDDDCTSPPA